MTWNIQVQPTPDPLIRNVLITNTNAEEQVIFSLSEAWNKNVDKKVFMARVKKHIQEIKQKTQECLADKTELETEISALPDL